MDEPREITEDYIRKFIGMVRLGGDVTFVQESSHLAVQDATGLMFVLQLADNVVPGETREVKDAE